jgi:hypothetical protein
MTLVLSLLLSVLYVSLLLLTLPRGCCCDSRSVVGAASPLLCAWVWLGPPRRPQSSSRVSGAVAVVILPIVTPRR